LLAAAFEVLGFELPVFVIRLGEMVGVDKRIATPDCSGRSPAIRINAMTNIPAQPPPTNATNNHQAEVI